ncbi:MAG: formylglycine-generating enzyme family protein [Blastocatellia bacterium]
MVNKSFYLRNLFVFLAVFLLFFSFSCKKSKPGDDRRVTPLEKPLAKVEEKYGIKFEDYLIPETIAIPAGQFMMGSEAEEEIPKEEQPRHNVSLKAFEIGRLEVTNAQYADFVKATGYENQKWQETNSERVSNMPAMAVSWEDAQVYCKWLSDITQKTYRLPTEAEWEYAAGGAQSVKFSWGNPWDPTQANVAGEKKAITQSASYSANAFGLYDMSGNVWEWCEDFFDAEFYKNSPTENPVKSSEESKSRVQRGGAWNSGEKYVRISFRSRNGQTVRSETTGFRVVLVP